MPKPREPRADTAPAAELLLVAAVFVASLVLTAGIPVLSLWVLAKLTDHYATVYMLALFGTPCLMVLWVRFVLSPLNRSYLRVAQHPLPLLEGSVTISVLLALVALAIWAVFFGSGREVWGPWPG